MLSYDRYIYCLNNALKSTDPNGYYNRIVEEEMRNRAAHGQGAQFFNNYPAVWSAYTNSISNGYTGGYGNFVTQYNNVITNSQTSSSNNGTNGFYVTWETNYTYTNGIRQEVRDKDGNLVGILLPEVGVGVEKHSMFVPSGGGGNGFINFIENTSVGRDVATLVAGGLDIATDGSIPEGKPRYQTRGFNPAVEAQVAKGMKVANGVVGVAGRVLGVLSIVEHGNQAYQAFDSGDIWQGIGYTSLTGLDIGLMFIKSNPAVLAGSVIYGVLDATAF
jgi:hypothetical protein